MKPPKPVMFDLDGCLVDFVVAFTSLAHKLFPEAGVKIVQSHQQPSYRWVDLDREQVNLVWREIDKSDDFWIDLPALVGEDVWHKILVLSDYRPVYFVTARPDYAKYQTEYWLRDHGIANPTVVMTKKKGEFAKAVGAGWSIEDKASNASMVSWLTEDKTASYLLDRPYNAAPDEFLASGVKRIYKVEEYLEAIANG